MAFLLLHVRSLSVLKSVEYNLKSAEFHTRHKYGLSRIAWKNYGIRSGAELKCAPACVPQHHLTRFKIRLPTVKSFYKTLYHTSHVESTLRGRTPDNLQIASRTIPPFKARAAASVTSCRGGTLRARRSFREWRNATSTSCRRRCWGACAVTVASSRRPPTGPSVAARRCCTDGSSCRAPCTRCPFCSASRRTVWGRAVPSRSCRQTTTPPAPAKKRR